MLQALLHRKHRRFDDNGMEIDIKEDTLTACVFGRLRYFEENIIKQILSEVARLNEDPFPAGNFGNLKREGFLFWPKQASDNKSYVEPDVVIKFSEVYILIEAKRWDGATQQSSGQWDEELESARLEYGTKEDIKTFKLIAIGGIEGITTPKPDVWLISWKDFFHIVDKSIINDSPHKKALVFDIQQSIEVHGNTTRYDVFLERFVKSAQTIDESNVNWLIAQWSETVQSSYTLAAFADKCHIVPVLNLKYFFKGATV